MSEKFKFITNTIILCIVGILLLKLHAISLDKERSYKSKIKQLEVENKVLINRNDSILQERISLKNKILYISAVKDSIDYELKLTKNENKIKIKNVYRMSTPELDSILTNYRDK